jgi:hypothetical protein
MRRARARGTGIERFKVARGAVTRIGRVVAVYLSFVVGFGLLALPLLFLLPKLGLDTRFFALVAPALGLSMLVGLLVYLNLPGWVEVGDDGVMVDLREKKRFVPFAELEDAAVFHKPGGLGKTFTGVTLKLGSGEALEVPFGEDQFGAGGRAAKLSARIRAKIEGYEAREHEEAAALLERGERSVDAWISRLRGLGEGANAGPRVAPIPVDRLWRIVESPATAPPARAGAAVALTACLDDEGKERLRVAAGSAAAPRLRVVLESVAAGDDEAAAAALAEVDAEAAEARR